MPRQMVGKPPQPVHVPGTSKGEELVKDEAREPGRNPNDPQGYREARDSTSINPQHRRPIDPSMRNMPPA